jgi:hypothetical protein
MQAFNLIRRLVLQMLDLAQERHCVIDSLPVPVDQFYLAPGSSGDWRAYGATFGKVAAESIDFSESHTPCRSRHWLSPTSIRPY